MWPQEHTYYISEKNFSVSMLCVHTVFCFVQVSSLSLCWVFNSPHTSTLLTPLSAPLVSSCPQSLTLLFLPLIYVIPKAVYFTLTTLLSLIVFAHFSRERSPALRVWNQGRLCLRSQTPQGQADLHSSGLSRASLVSTPSVTNSTNLLYFFLKISPVLYCWKNGFYKVNVLLRRP